VKVMISPTLGVGLSTVLVIPTSAWGMRVGGTIGRILPSRHSTCSIRRAGRGAGRRRRGTGRVTTARNFLKIPTFMRRVLGDQREGKDAFRRAKAGKVRRARPLFFPVQRSGS